MNEAAYRAEMAKQARLQNLIAMRALCRDSAAFASKVVVNNLDNAIKRLSEV